MSQTIRTSQDLGKAIRANRLARGLTQDELAARCGVGRRFIAELEAGKPTSQLAKALLAASEVGLHLIAQTSGHLPERDASAGTSAESEDDPLADLPRF